MHSYTFTPALISSSRYLRFPCSYPYILEHYILPHILRALRTLSLSYHHLSYFHDTGTTE